jgi:hypothetical protein
MGHEDAVYLAKLAEQAERYEGAYRLIEFARPTAIVEGENVRSR